MNLHAVLVSAADRQAFGRIDAFDAYHLGFVSVRDEPPRQPLSVQLDPGHVGRRIVTGGKNDFHRRRLVTPLDLPARAPPVRTGSHRQSANRSASRPDAAPP